MAIGYMQLVLTPAVQKAQDKYFGSHQAVESGPESDALTPEEADFIASRDSFYMATVSETGWPYLQHRGGPTGFVKVLGPNLLGFADFKGNRQLVSTGNLDLIDRVALLMMDYPARTRLKLLGHARVLDSREHSELVNQLAPESLRATVERLFLIQVISYDWNCPQYITARFTAAKMERYAAPLKGRIADLEAQIAARPEQARPASSNTGMVVISKNS
ncbi:MAG: pyridoxamine 5'-phosphate oxidase family protein [Verrucomicrobia bacterium]|nr:pyridoxamine 5'-phosphate oxidase family protein [Verrucomicrobiota bacterium]